VANADREQVLREYFEDRKDELLVFLDKVDKCREFLNGHVMILPHTDNPAEILKLLSEKTDKISSLLRKIKAILEEADAIRSD
jgi:hypothetical protein